MDWVLPLRSDGATQLANAFTWLGYTIFFLIALPLSYWLWDRGRAIRLVVLIAITAIINGWLKDYWQDPRPDPKYWLDQRIAGSYGRPSGHAQVSFAMWFWIAYELKRPWVWAAAVFIVAGVCLSRLYLGVHDVDDVLTGLALGLIGIFIFVWFLSPTFDAIRKMPGIAHLAIIVAVGAILFLTWPNGESPDTSVGLLAILFGWVLGADIDHRLAPNAPILPVWWIRIAMGIAGVSVLLALLAGLASAARQFGIEGVATSYAISAALGFYMTGIAPLAFRAVRLVR